MILPAEELSAVSLSTGFEPRSLCLRTEAYSRRRRDETSLATSNQDCYKFLKWPQRLQRFPAFYPRSPQLLDNPHTRMTSLGSKSLQSSRSLLNLDFSSTFHSGSVSSTLSPSHTVHTSSLDRPTSLHAFGAPKCGLKLIVTAVGGEIRWGSEVNLPEEHLPFVFNDPELSRQCDVDPRCPFKKYLHRNVCWGYEANCSSKARYHQSECTGEHNGWVKSKDEQLDTFDREADFGYIKERRAEMFQICQSNQKQKSKFECVKNLRFCRGSNIFINFTSLLTVEAPMRYRMDVLKKGQIGGWCDVDEAKLNAELGHMSPLQSWAPEIQHFTSIASHSKCDVTLRKPTFIMKLDATVNMYHHFCDFLNLYATLHLHGNFSDDINILIWDMTPYRSNFKETWNAFTRHPILDLQRFAGKTVCLKEVVFPLLPRMIYGMYYNMPLISGCCGSGLFRAFNRHILHKLAIKRDDNEAETVRVTLLSRSTTYRRILNQLQLIEGLNKVKNVKAQIVDFNWNTPFLQQLKIIHNTDILIGMHGAGLTHMLFLPDWAAVFEIYNCEDGGCYHDLSRLRGLAYFTWEKLQKLKSQDEGHHPTEGAHAKFTNYEFDVDEFLRIVRKAVKHVRKHSKWRHRHDEL